jgi:hypothetical protein
VIGKQWQTAPISPLRGQLLVLAGRPQELIIGTTDANDFVVKTNNSEKS